MSIGVDASVADLVSYLDASTTPYHAVRETARRLDAAGYRQLDERATWSIAPGDRVYVTRGGASIAAFRIGTSSPVESGFQLVGAHTDSPNLRVKPNADLSATGCAQLAVEPYGGVLNHTWLDRDLSLAGRVFLRRARGIEPVLLDPSRALLRIPSLAIHLNRTVNTDGLVVNAQRHLPPLYALLSSSVKDVATLISHELRVQGVDAEAKDVLGFDLMTVDSQRAALLGASNEFVVSGRLDNLVSCHAAATALLGVDEARPSTQGIVLYDHEECGSKSAQGAASSFLGDILKRLLATSAEAPSHDAFPRAIARSFFISADMAHAGHPNYADRHDPQHMPLLGGGPVVKINTNQSYATDGETWSRFESYCLDAGVPTQRFVARSDLGCGSTIGPMTAAGLGIRTVDVGSPMLSMHSCREMMAAADVPRMIAVLRAFFA